MPYRIEYPPEVLEHLEYLTAYQKAIVLDIVDEQLIYQPDVRTKQRKPMNPNPLATWELRIADLRVYYEIEEESKTVHIRAVGIKDRNEVRIGGEVMQL